MKKVIIIPALVIIAAAAYAFAETPGITPNADNSGLNKRDVVASSSTLTPPDQSRGSKSDVELTRLIRRSVMKDKSLSSKAHNVKIITLKGVATLRGPVDSSAERERIGSLASRVMGSDENVINQLEVKAE